MYVRWHVRVCPCGSVVRTALIMLRRKSIVNSSRDTIAALPSSIPHQAKPHKESGHELMNR